MRTLNKGRKSYILRKEFFFENIPGIFSISA